MKVNFSQQELDFLINGVTEELIGLVPLFATIEAVVSRSSPISKELLTESIEMLKDYKARNRLLIRLWQLDRSEDDSVRTIAKYKHHIRKADETIARLKQLSVAPDEQKAEQN